MTDVNATIELPIRDHTTIANAPAGTVLFFFDLSGQLRSINDAGVQRIYILSDAAGVSFIPNGTIASTNVQAAIQEVRDESQLRSEKNQVNGYVGIDSLGKLPSLDAGALFNILATNITSTHVIGAPTDITSIERVIDHMWSAGVTDGAVITDNGNGTVNISGANVILRATKSVTITSSGTLATATSSTPHGFITGDVVSIDGALDSAYNGNFPVTVIDTTHFTYVMLSTPAASPATGTIIATDEHSPIYIAAVPPSGILTPTDHTISFVYTSYDNGSPTWHIGTAPTIPADDSKSVAYTIAREGNTLYILNFRAQNVDYVKKFIFRAIETDRFKHVPGGTNISEVPTRQVSVSAGAFYYGLNKIDHPAFTSFTTVYRGAVAGTWTYTPGQLQLSNQLWDNGSGTLATVSTNNYIAFYLYVMNNSPSSLLVQYGQGDFTTIAAAQAAPVPTPPDIAAGVGVLIGRVIIAKGATTFADISSAFSTIFTPSVSTNHENLSGLQGGAPNEHVHLTNAQVTILTSSSSQKVPSVLVLRDVNGYSMFEGVGIGTNTPTSRLHASGSIASKFVNVSANYSAGDEHTIFSDDSANNVVITLPDPSTCQGREYEIKTVGATGSSFHTSIQSAVGLVEFTSIFDLYAGSRSAAKFKNNGSNWFLM